MKVILLQDVRGIGRKLDVKDVADGYAQNFLLPRKLAERATAERVREVEGKRATVLKEREMAEKELLEALSSLKGITVTLAAPANDQGHLFKGVKPAEIVDALKVQAKVAIPADAIMLAAPIKSVGTHTIPVEVGTHHGSFDLSITKA